MSPPKSPDQPLNELEAQGSEKKPETASEDIQGVEEPKEKKSMAEPEEKPGTVLSTAAIDKRLRRIFTPRSDGTYAVSEDFVKKYLAKGDERQKLLVMFEKCDYKPDPGDQSGWMLMLFEVSNIVQPQVCLLSRILESKNPWRCLSTSKDFKRLNRNLFCLPEDEFVTRCKRITQQIDETELDIGYSFMTEEDMQEANFPQ